MSLVVDIRHTVGGFTLEADFAIDGPVTALFGPSGSGKTTIINVIAGLVRPARGRVVTDGTVLLDTQARIDLPRHRRRVGYVFQEGRLFPHLTVRQNLLYGRFFAPRGDAVTDFDSVVAMLGIGHLLVRRPSGLSGGEKQRVAIGRALLANPRVLLMDEPLAALDESRKAEVLPFLERLRDEVAVPIVYVSHSLDEVLRLASHMVVLDGGRVAGSGPVEAIMSRVDFAPFARRRDAGAVLSLRVAGHDEPGGVTRLEGRLGVICVPRIEATVGARRRLWVHARDVILATDRPVGLSAQNIVAATIDAIVPREGGGADVALDCNGDRLIARVTGRAIQELSLAPGRSIYAIVKSRALD
jgi:molybdate transport system ATP-binding protein